MEIEHPVSEEEHYLLWTLIHMALADQRVSPVEVAFIEGVMKRIDLPQAERKQVRRVLDMREPPPPEATAKQVVDYALRLDIFRDALELAFADGHFAKAESAKINALANALGLHLQDMQTIWQRAKRHFPHEVE